MNDLMLKLIIRIVDLLKSAGQFDSSEIKLAADKEQFLTSKGWIVVKPSPYTYT